MNLKHSKFSITPEGIVVISCTEHVYNLNDLKKHTEIIGKLVNYKKALVLIITDDFTNVDKEAREYMATKEAAKYSIAEAFVIHSLGQKILANFYLKVNKPTVPTMFFTEKEKAINWLKSFQ